MRPSHPLCPILFIYFSDGGQYVPNLRLVRNVVDRMKTVNAHMTLTANHRGELVFHVESAVVPRRTVFRNLENVEPRAAAATNAAAAAAAAADADANGPLASQGGAFGTLPPDAVEARISIKSFFQFLNAHPAPPEHVMLSIIRQQAVILFLWEDDLSITFYIPITAE